MTHEVTDVIKRRETFVLIAPQLPSIRSCSTPLTSAKYVPVVFEGSNTAVDNAVGQACAETLAARPRPPQTLRPSSASAGFRP